MKWLVFVMVLASLARAQSEQAPAAAAPANPGARSGHAMAHEPFKSRLVLFGGVDAAGKMLDDTWAFDGKQWTRANGNGDKGGTGPSARVDAQMAFDGKQVLLFGGQAEKGPLNDTWKLTDEGWKPLVEGGPPPRSRADMAFDFVRGRVVMFGGRGADDKPLGDTWEWTGDSWYKIDVQGPPARSSHALTFNDARRAVVLYGGYGDKVLGDLWEWNGSAWSQLPDPPAPARLHCAMDFDLARRRMTVFGGFGADKRLNDLWEWDGKTWKELKPEGPAPEARAEHDGAYLPDRGLVIFGGVTGQERDAAERKRSAETWWFDGKSWGR